MDEDIEIRKLKQKDLRKKQWLLQKRNISGQAKMQLWFALFRSKYVYGSEILTTVSKSFKALLKQQMYSSIKFMFNIRSRVS